MSIKPGIRYQPHPAFAVDANGNKTSKTGMSSAGTMNHGNSRLGVRGVEDLGGGMKVGFNFETGLTKHRHR